MHPHHDDPFYRPERRIRHLQMASLLTTSFSPSGEARDLVIACRGSVSEGLGHLYRAQTFALQAQKRHRVAVVARTDAEFSSIFDGLEHPVVLAADDEELALLVCQQPRDVVVFDMVDIDGSAFADIRRKIPVAASISPVFRHAAETDLFFTRGNPPAGLIGPSVFAGLDYTILNSRCEPIPDPRFQSAVAQSVLPIMISFGGADADNHSRLVLEVLREVDRPLLLWIMLGDGYLHSHDELIEAIRMSKRHEIILARTNRSMWSVAANCALAVLSSGLSTIEAIYAGLPVISMHRLNDPSRQIETAYDRLCVSGGSFADGSFWQLKPLIEALYDDRGRLTAMRNSQSHLIDGRGTERVLQAIEDHLAARRA
jgi:spore coat polysaccharide biosynthesis predicted glycosyltransferase SpsG